MVTRPQLLALGLSSQAIKRRVANGRLHPVRRGIYAVGRPGLTTYGIWLAAVLSCGEGAVLSHLSAAMLWGIRAPGPGAIEVSIAAHAARRSRGVLGHRRARLPAEECVVRNGIPVTSPALTLIDLAATLRTAEVESAVNEADKLHLIDPESLRIAIPRLGPLPGAAVLRDLLDRRTFALTDSELERRFPRWPEGPDSPSRRRARRSAAFGWTSTGRS